MFAAVFTIAGSVMGAFLVSTARPGINAVVVEATNLSGMNIQKVVLTHERGSVEICNLLPGKMQTLAFFPGGENAYTLKAYFENGSVIEGLGGYVEPGYSMKHKITATNISTEYAF